MINSRLRGDFIRFLKSQSIIGVAIGIVIGQAFAKLITSIIDGLVMPFLEIFYRDTRWEQVTISIWRLHLKVGIVLSAILNFLVISLVVFLVIKFILKGENKFYDADPHL